MKDCRRKFTVTIPQAVRTATEESLEEGAEDVVKLQRVLCPVDTGELFRSINWTWGAAPRGSVGVGRMVPKDGRPLITIYAGGNEATTRRQRRASGTRARDQKRLGSFDSDVARMVEFGTKNMPAQPFYYPAWRAKRSQFRGRTTRAINKAIRNL